MDLCTDNTSAVPSNRNRSKNKEVAAHPSPSSAMSPAPAPPVSPAATASDVLRLPMGLLNKVVWVLFLASAYHLWPGTERLHSPAHFHLRGLSLIDLCAILTFISSLLYLYGFFGIPFVQTDLAPPPASFHAPAMDAAELLVPAGPPAAAAVAPAVGEDEEVVQAVLSGKVPSYALESRLGDCRRAAGIRREALRRTTGRELEGLPMENFDYNSILGRCCEMPIGFVQLPVGVAGPLFLDGAEYYLPMATTEGCLVASTNRGCKAIAESGGAASVVLRDGMTRAPAVRFGTAARAAQLKFFLELPDNLETLALVFNRSSRFVRLQAIKCAQAGRNLYLRFVCSTGDAMGMNMVSNGVQNVLDFLQLDFPDMDIISITGNFCSDKKPTAVNWIEGRGKSVVCEATIKEEVVKKVLKTSVPALVELNTVKNLAGSAMAGALGGFNAHASNIVTAIFIATGQDPAQNVESSHCITMMEAVNGSRDLHVSVTMPSIEVGTVGGGTHLASQAACLELLGVKGASVETPGANARRLATIVAGAVLAGELSLMSALAAGQLVKSHMKYNRSTKDIANATSC